MNRFVFSLLYICVLVYIFYCDARRIVKHTTENDDTTITSDSTDELSLADVRRNLFSSSQNIRVLEQNNLRGNTDRFPKDYTEHKVNSLPGLKANLDFVHYAGLIPIDENRENNIFYWLVESPTESASKPLIIWLNGGLFLYVLLFLFLDPWCFVGPGCSSMDGLWLELGPFRLDDKHSVTLNPSSWHNVANILFVDQPVGTGFSFTKQKNGYAKNDEMINSHFYKFLLNFFKLHARYSSSSNSPSKSRTVYFTGESHAGHFIPTIVSYILKKNDELSSLSSLGGNSGEITTGIMIDIQGIALGNPWIDPINQYNPAEYAHGLGLLTSGQVNKLKEQDNKCRRLLTSGNYNSNICISLLDHVIDSTTLNGHHRLLMYDIRKFLHNPHIFPPGHETLEKYLNRKDVKTALHVLETPQKFQECTDPPYYALSHQDGKGVMNEIQYLLERGNLDLLIYNGQYDLICNHLNIEQSLDLFNWSGRNDWLNAKPGVWAMNKKPAGYVRQAKNLQTLLGTLLFLLLFPLD
jgi:carboxypeptidase D